MIMLPSIVSGCAERTASAVPNCCFCSKNETPSVSSTFFTNPAPWPTTTRISLTPAFLQHAITLEIIGFPATGCSTLGSDEFIRVPLPAAKIMAVKGKSLLLISSFSVMTLNYHSLLDNPAIFATIN